MPHAAARAVPPGAAAVLVAPGPYRLRITATDASGCGGAVDGEVRAELAEAAPVKLSGLVLGAAVGGAFAPRLQFRDEQVAVGFVEVYGAPPGAVVAANLELAASEDRPAAISLPARVSSPSAAGPIPIYGGIQIDALPPTGDYVIRAVVALIGQVVGRTARTLRKTAG